MTQDYNAYHSVSRYFGEPSNSVSYTLRTGGYAYHISGYVNRGSGMYYNHQSCRGPIQQFNFRVKISSARSSWTESMMRNLEDSQYGTAAAISHRDEESKTCNKPDLMSMSVLSRRGK